MIPKLKSTAVKGVRPLVAAVLSWILLLGAVALALRLPEEERIRPLSGPGRLDYSQTLGERFGQLSAGFIARILGLDLDFGNSSGRILASDRERSRLPFSGQPRVVVNHPFNNDGFANAYPIPSIPFTAKTNTRAAERESGEPGDCAGVGGSVWYRYRIGGDIGLMATTFGSNYPTAIGVFAGDDLRDLRLVGCNSHPAGNARVPFPARAGQTYFFQVTGPAGGGDLVFNLDPLGATSRVSVSTEGRESNGGSSYSSISENGRYVAFHSAAEDVVEGDTNSCPPYFLGEPSCPDVFVHDRLTGVTERVSVSSAGRQAEGGPSGSPAISGNGRYVAFFSLADDLVAGDTNDRWDVFVHDRVTRTTSRVSVSSRGEQGTGPLSDAFLQPPAASVSFDGRLIAFTSDFSNLVDGDANACTAPGSPDPTESGHPAPGTHAPVTAIYTCRDVFVHDTAAHTTTRVSVSSSGKESIGDSAGVFMSPEGRYVAFSSDAPDLVDGDTNNFRDVFVHDRVTGRTELVSVSLSGGSGDSNSGGFGVRGHNTISSDGRYVAFVSTASNLAPEDRDPDSDTFVYDRLTKKTRLVSGSDPGETGNHSTISANGRFIVFSAQLPPAQGSEEVRNQVYVYDLWTDTTTQISVSSAGEEAGDFAFEPEISADGRYVAFHSEATNLVANDENGKSDVFVHELGWAR